MSTSSKGNKGDGKARVSPPETSSAGRTRYHGASSTDASSVTQLQALRDRAWSRGGFAGTEERPEERRKAWLQALAIPYQSVASFPTSASLHESASTASSAADLKSEASSNGLETSILSPSTSAGGGISIDSEGWQICSDTGILAAQSGDDERDASPAGWEDSSNEWKKAESRRSRRNRGRGDTLRDRELGEGSSGTLGVPRQTADSASASTSSRRSRDHNRTEESQSTGTSTSSMPSTPLLSGSLFSELPIEGDEPITPTSSRFDQDDLEMSPTSPSSSSKAKCTDTKIASSGASPQKLQSSQPSEVPDTASSLYRLPASFSDHLATHPDERQVELDIQRSFVGCSEGSSLKDPATKQARRRQLQDLIVGTLRRYPKLHYYQGYHDVVSVLLLVLSPSQPRYLPSSESAMAKSSASLQVWPSEADFQLVLTAAVRLSLFYLRDFMAARIDPCLGWLKVLRNAVRHADEDFSRRVVEGASPLPFFALSWLITVLAHDVEVDSETSRRLLDVVLVQGPESIVWILAALVLQAKRGPKGERSLSDARSASTDDQSRSGDDSGIDADEDDDSDDADMLHHSFSKLPTLLTGLSGLDAAENLLSRAHQLGQSMLRQSSGERKHRQQPQPIWIDIMGPHSVLNTWSAPNTRGDDSTKAGSSTSLQTQLEMEAENCLSGRTVQGSADLSSIVINADPSPPASEAGDDDDVDAEAKEKKQQKRHTFSRPLPFSSKHMTKRSTNATVLVGVSVFVVAGAAVLLSNGSSRGSGGVGLGAGGKTFAAGILGGLTRSKAAEELAQVGKAWLDVVFAATGGGG
ncbi:unnamed protein product [Jaminaea pallidilutea]